MPQHKLKLKIGAVVMLLRNLNVSDGLCNGVRMVVTRMERNTVVCRLISNDNLVVIPRIELAPIIPSLPFILRRRQFPIRLAFSMTINKSQGQTFDQVGIYFKKPVFSHGQLYVALSRVRSRSAISIEVHPSSLHGYLKKNNIFYTKNIVYNEVIRTN